MYNRNALLLAIEQINNFNITVTKKEGHKGYIWELSKLMNNIYDKTNCTLILPEWNTYFYEYKNKVETLYKETTKTELDKCLRLTVMSIKKELEKCIELCA